MATTINDLGFRAVIRIENGEERHGFRVTVGGGLGPLPTEGQLLIDFLPVERVVNLCEAVLRVFNAHGNRGNKNKARLKFVLRERGFDWLKETIEREYADILTNGGIEMPDEVPEGFGGFQSNPPALGTGADLPVLDNPRASDPAFDAWLETNVEEQKQRGYAIVTVRVPQGNITDRQMHAVARTRRLDRRRTAPFHHDSERHPGLHPACSTQAPVQRPAHDRTGRSRRAGNRRHHQLPRRL